MNLSRIQHTLYHRALPVYWIMAAVLVLPGISISQMPDNQNPAQLTAHIDKQTAKIGDLLWLTLTYNLPEDARLTEKKVLKGIDDLIIVEQMNQPNQIKLRILVGQLESFDLGPIGLNFIDSEGQEQIVETAPIGITVLSNLGDKPEDASLRPIQDIIPIQSRLSQYLLAACVVLVLLGVAIVLFWWRKKKNIIDVEAKMTDPPHRKAEKDIDALLASGLFEKGEVKAFYYSFSETIRRYMEAIRGFPAAEMTTEEISRIVKEDPHDHKIIPLLKQVDLIKFADTIPAPESKDQDIQKARNYIAVTRPDTVDSPADKSSQEVSP